MMTEQIMLSETTLAARFPEWVKVDERTVSKVLSLTLRNSVRLPRPPG